MTEDLKPSAPANPPAPMHFLAATLEGSIRYKNTIRELTRKTQWPDVRLHIRRQFGSTLCQWDFTIPNTDLVMTRIEVSDRIEKLQQQQRKYCDKKWTVARRYKLGDGLCNVKTEPAKSSKRKMMSLYTGPMLFKEVFSNSRSIIENLEGTYRTRRKRRQ